MKVILPFQTKQQILDRLQEEGSFLESIDHLDIHVKENINEGGQSEVHGNLQDMCIFLSELGVEPV